MEAIKLKKKELLEITNISPNNDEFNQMIAGLSKEKPQNFKLKKCSKAELRKTLSLLQFEFYQCLIDNKQYKVQEIQFLDTIDFVQFIQEREKFLIMWYEFLQNNAGYYIFIKEYISLEEKLKYIDRIHLVYKETQEKIDEIQQKKIFYKQIWKTKKIKIQNQEQLFDEIFN